MNSNRTNVPVYVRIRPCVSQVIGGGGGGGVGYDVDEAGDAPSCLTLGPRGLLVREGKSNCTFTFATDVVAGSDQTRAFQTIASDLVEKLHTGYSCTMIAYGQTGSGKTYTMFGPPGCLTESALAGSGGSTPSTWGIFPRVCMHLLHSSSANCALHLSASAIEIYQEDAFDLLMDSQQLVIGKEQLKKEHDSNCCCKLCTATKLELKRKNRVSATASSDIDDIKLFADYSEIKSPSSSKAGSNFSTVGERVVSLSSPTDVARLARTVELSRVAHGHALNARSSRSHCIVCVYISRMETTSPSSPSTASSSPSVSVTKQQFRFVDLAGSERIHKSGVTGSRQKEATCINQSLSVLGLVILKLGRGEGHIPYRNSTLTMLLKSSFEGKSFTSVIINISEEAQHGKETISSLRFGESMTGVSAKVSNNASIVVGSRDLELEAEKRRNDVQCMIDRLAVMERQGLGGRFAASAVPSEKVTFLENVKRMELAKKRVDELKIRLAESRGSGSGSGFGSGNSKSDSSSSTAQTAQSITSRLKRAEWEYLVAWEIVTREKMIPSFWIPPTAKYKELERTIAASLSSL